MGSGPGAFVGRLRFGAAVCSKIELCGVLWAARLGILRDGAECLGAQQGRFRYRYRERPWHTAATPQNCDRLQSEGTTDNAKRKQRYTSRLLPAFPCLNVHLSLRSYDAMVDGLPELSAVVPLPYPRRPTRLQRHVPAARLSASDGHRQRQLRHPFEAFTPDVDLLPPGAERHLRLDQSQSQAAVLFGRQAALLCLARRPSTLQRWPLARS